MSSVVLIEDRSTILEEARNQGDREIRLVGATISNPTGTLRSEPRTPHILRTFAVSRWRLCHRLASACTGFVAIRHPHHQVATGLHLSWCRGFESRPRYRKPEISGVSGPPFFGPFPVLVLSMMRVRME